MSTNIDYWNKVLLSPNPIFEKLFIREKNYLKNNIQNDSMVLDVACGNGRNIENILCVSKNIIGIDIDSKIVKKTRLKFKKNPQVDVIEGSVFNLPFPKKSFDVVVLLMTLVNFEDKKIAALKEMKRVLKDNGKMIISVYSEDSLINRLEQYKKIKLPIKYTLETKVVFEDMAEAGTSEQFSVNDINGLGKKIGMKVANLEKVPNIAYIFEFTNN